MAPIAIDFPQRKLRSKSAKSKSASSEEPKTVKAINRSPLKQVKTPRQSPIKSSVSSATKSSGRVRTPHKIALNFDENQENNSLNANRKILIAQSPKKKLETSTIVASPTKRWLLANSKQLESPLKDPTNLKSPLKQKPYSTESPRRAAQEETSWNRVLRSPLKNPLRLLSQNADNEEVENKIPIQCAIRRTPRKIGNADGVDSGTEKDTSTDEAPTLIDSLKSPRKEKLSCGKSPCKELLEPLSDRILRTPQKTFLSTLSDNEEEDGENKNANVYEVRRSPRKMAKVGRGVLFRADVTPLVEARKALSTALPPENAGLIGREKQLNALKEFLQRNLIKHGKKPANGKRSIYVSGPPGTGKTTCLKHLIRNLKEQDSKSGDHKTVQPHCIFVNCMALKSSAAIYATIAENILPMDESFNIGQSVESHKKAVENIITGSKAERKVLLVLDEIDQLDSKCQDVLYTLFEWPYLRNSKLILVGIANSLDLTDRILPRLKVGILNALMIR